MSLYAGIDLHSNNSVLAVIDEHNQVLRQCRLPNKLPTILKALEPFHDELVGTAVESTYNSGTGSWTTWPSTAIGCTWSTPPRCRNMPA